MRALFPCIILLSFLCGCAKDQKVPEKKIPFVEYRDPFAGTYKGVLLTGWLGPNNAGPPPDTTYNFTEVIAKTLDNDSTLFIQRLQLNTHFRTDSKPYYHHQEGPRYDLTLIFTKDSVYYYYGEGSWAQWYYTNFKGKRQ